MEQPAKELLADPEEPPAAIPEEKTPQEFDYPDGGLQAWSVVLGSFLMVATTFGFTNAFGVLQTYLGENQLASSSESAIAWIGSIQIFFSFAGSIVSGRVFDTYGAKWVFITGSIFCIVSQFTSAACTEYWEFFLAMGVTMGIGNGLVYLPSMAVTSHWFQKRRALALGVFSAGVSTGGAIWPIVVSKLIGAVGFTWTLRIVGFIMMPLTIIAALLQKRRLPRRPPGPILDFSFFRDVRFVLFCCAYFMALWASWIPFFFVQKIASIQGISPDVSFYLVSIINATSLPGRVLCGFLSDHVGPHNVLLLSMLTGAIILFTGCSLDSAAGVFIWTIFYGMFNGALISLQAACMSRICPDMRKIGTMLGMSSTFSSIATLTGTPIAGAIIGLQNGGYIGALCFGGAAMMTGSLLILTSKLIHGHGNLWVNI